MPTLALAALSAVLGIAVVFGGRGMAYVIGDDDFFLAFLAFIIGFVLTACALGGTIAAYITLVERHTIWLLVAAGICNLIGALIILRLYHNWAEDRYRRCYPPRRGW